MCLYLPAHSTHLLQLLDVNIFGFLKQNHKTLPSKKTRFIMYKINKIDFIFLIQNAQLQDINSQNIQLT